MYKLLVAIPLVGILCAIGMIFAAKYRTRNVADPEVLTTDPVLLKLQALNPQLRLVDEFVRVPAFWIRPRGVKEGILFPRAEAEAARIQVRECDLSAIPPQVLYPNRSEIACVEIENSRHKLQAYFFRTRDRIKKVVAFFEAPLDKTRQFGTSRSNVEERSEYQRRDDGSKEFLFSYLIWERYDTVAFVGYREELKP